MSTVENDSNPVLLSAKYILENTEHVRISPEGIDTVADELLGLVKEQKYSPHTWKTHPLHFIPPTPFDLSHPRTKQCVDWIFLVSALNFSFWSELQGEPTRYGVMWKESWEDTSGKVKKWEGYWSLLASINKALESGIPITDPSFYASEIACPDSIIESIFEPADGCIETIPLLKERIRILREVGRTLVEKVPGHSFMGLLEEAASQPSGQNRTLRLLNDILDYFPSFRDESIYKGRKVVFWKRAQILIAEIWAAFYPLDSSEMHPLVPDSVDCLTMFADYRVPQMLQHLGTTIYSDNVIETLKGGKYLEYGSDMECSIRTSSIIAVQQLREKMVWKQEQLYHAGSTEQTFPINSVLIDFLLWDLAKLVESGQHSTGRVSIPLPCHRTRSTYY
ncbi:hypothetical protein FRC19_001180 [Serendipita sp. 401]|nr:hypothetical protein FRC19_001180 [Serendipita sp. 401]KAG9024739.1 hypothetical protein FS842_005410 [Serendipita sp. 407]